MRLTQAASSAEGTARFTCQRCGFTGEADVTGLGQGVQSFLNSAGTAERRARHDAELDIARTIARARCPACKRRNPGVVRGFLMPYAIGVAVAIVAGVIVGYWPTWSGMNMREDDKAFLRWLCPLLLGGIALLVVPIQMFIRWQNPDARIRWLRSGASPVAPRP
jgi:hypothetical protein